jgi:hypothetical protein
LAFISYNTLVLKTEQDSESYRNQDD